jgi:hypothetical protein
VFLHERQQAEYATDSPSAFVTMNVIGNRAERPDAAGRREERERFGGRSTRAIGVLDAMPPHPRGARRF